MSTIRALRKELEMSVPQFARLLCVDQRSVLNWELGKAKPSGAHLAATVGIQEALDRFPAKREIILDVTKRAAAMGGLGYLMMLLFEHQDGLRSVGGNETYDSVPFGQRFNSCLVDECDQIGVWVCKTTDGQFNYRCENHMKGRWKKPIILEGEQDGKKESVRP